MDEVVLSKNKIEKMLKQASCACGWIIGLQIYSAFYYFFTGLVGSEVENVSLGVWVAGVGALLFWLIRRTKKEKSIFHFSILFLIYFGLRVWDVASFVEEEKWFDCFVALGSGIPICYFLIKGIRATIDLKVLKYAQQQKT